MLVLCVVLLAAAVPAIIVLLVRPFRARRHARAAGFVEGALIDVSGAELMVQQLGWRATHIASEDGGITIISNEALLSVARIVAGPGEPVRVAIRFVLPAVANLELARTIVLRTVGSSARVSRAVPIRCETTAISPTEVEFVVQCLRARSRVPGRTAE